jgi:hypothetical protein
MDKVTVSTIYSSRLIRKVSSSSFVYSACAIRRICAAGAPPYSKNPTNLKAQLCRKHEKMFATFQWSGSESPWAAYLQQDVSAAWEYLNIYWIARVSWAQSSSSTDWIYFLTVLKFYSFIEFTATWPVSHIVILLRDELIPAIIHADYCIALRYSYALQTSQIRLPTTA